MNYTKENEWRRKTPAKKKKDLLTCLSKVSVCWGINWASHNMIALDQFYSDRTVFKTCKIKSNKKILDIVFNLCMRTTEVLIEQ